LAGLSRFLVAAGLVIDLAGGQTIHQNLMFRPEIQLPAVPPEDQPSVFASDLGFLAALPIG
jgi:hypothetical protein